MTSRHTFALFAILGVCALGIAVQASRTLASGATTSTEPPFHEGFAITSDGIGVITADDAAPIGVLHVRVVIVNRTDETTWSLDVARARLHTPTSTVAPLFARADTMALPTVMVSAGEQQVIHLYFPAPNAKEALSSALALTWPMNAPSATVAGGRVSRDAFTVRSTAEPAAVGIGGEARRWWADPSHPWPVFRHRSGPITSQPPKTITVVSEPTWDLAWLSVSTTSTDDDDRAPTALECDEW
jgi:hypothetical protein